MMAYCVLSCITLGNDWVSSTRIDVQITLDEMLVSLLNVYVSLTNQESMSNLALIVPLVYSMNITRYITNSPLKSLIRKPLAYIERRFAR